MVRNASNLVSLTSIIQLEMLAIFLEMLAKWLEILAIFLEMLAKWLEMLAKSS